MLEFIKSAKLFVGAKFDDFPYFKIRKENEGRADKDLNLKIK